MIMMTMDKPHQYIVQFFVTLATLMLIALAGMTLYRFTIGTPVIVDLDKPFKVITKVVNPGGVVQYRTHYYKRLDIPGDITKQLVLEVKDTGEIIYIPLSATAGHLPVGEVKMLALVQIPDWTPEGIGYIKLSSSYNLGWAISHNVATTEKFEVRR